MITSQVLSIITDLIMVAIVVTTWHYTRSRQRTLQWMKRQAKIEAITAEISVLNSRHAGNSGSASTERANRLVQELYLLTAEHKETSDLGYNIRRMFSRAIL